MYKRQPVFLWSLALLSLLALLFTATLTAYGNAATPPQSMQLWQVSPTAPPPAFDGAALAEVEGDWFASAGLCTNCHAEMTDQAGNDVSTVRQWRGSMMANAARDPYWQATVRTEALEYPALAAVIEEKCATCHMPMAEQTAKAAGDEPRVLDDGFLNPDNPLHDLAMDGVSCTACHQIEPDNFGDPTSFSGGYVINFELPLDERRSYGPFEVAEQQASRMTRFSGYVPVQGLHIQESEMCATCHTLYTPYVDASGEVAGTFAEQTPYLEWLNSAYAETQSCQDCHMPEVAGPVPLTNSSSPAREGVSQHAIVGGNNTILAIMRAGGEVLGVTASSADFDATLAAMAEQLQTQTATVALDNVSIADGVLNAEIAVSSMAGHKLPTSFPSRRVWLHVTVQDGSGAVIFESGGYDAAGQIMGNDNDADPAAYEPHYAAISSPDEVQIYEAILGNSEGEVTTTLLAAATYLKDNRILPAGFDAAAALPEIAVVGVAASDRDFVAGGDQVQLVVDLGEADGPFTVTVELLYQSITYRWAENLRGGEGAEVAQFMGLYDEVGNLPGLIAAAVAMIDVTP